MEMMERTIEKFQKGVAVTGLFVLPLCFSTLFSNGIATTKLIWLWLVIVALLLTWIIKTIWFKKFSFNTGSFDFPVVLLIAAAIASGLIRSPNKAEAFFLPGNATVIALSAILYFLINQFQPAEKKQIIIGLLSSAIAVSVFSLFSVLGIFSQAAGLPALVRASGFSPLESHLSALIFLILFLPIAIAQIVSDSRTVNKIFYVLASFILALGIFANLYNILPGKPNFPKTQGLNISWAVAIDTLKESPLLGIGPSNYLTAFNRFRPISYNNTDIWSMRFTAANSFFLTVLTETGLLGFSALLLTAVFAWRLAARFSRERKLVGWETNGSPEAISLILSFVAMVFFEANITLLCLFFLLLAVNAHTRKININLSASDTDSRQIKPIAFFPAVLMSLPVLAVIVISAIFLLSSARAEIIYVRGVTAAGKGDGKTAYDLIQKAISVQPKIDRYHASFAQLNFVLANTIARNKSDGKLSDAERETISSLISQSISAGKSAVALNPTRSSNWILLADLYQSIMSYAKGADSFAIQTYNQAIAFDPTDPMLRISLGQTLFAAGSLDEAIDAFKSAVYAKSNLANARYNLAAAYRQKGEVEKAIAEMTNTLSLVDRNSKDYEVVKKELEALEAKKPAPSDNNQSENLSQPKSSETPVIKPPIELPTDAQPPETVSSSTPTPTVEP